MLVLSRFINEVILIGTDPPVRVTVVDILGGKVKLGFDAPSTVPIHRLEVAQRKESAQ